LKRRIVTGLAATGLLSTLLVAFPASASAYGCLGQRGSDTIGDKVVATYTYACNGGPVFRTYIWCKQSVNGTTQKKYFGKWAEPTVSSSRAYCTSAYPLMADAGKETG
jgi:hypothetical protein